MLFISRLRHQGKEEEGPLKLVNYREAGLV